MTNILLKQKILLVESDDLLANFVKKKLEDIFTIDIVKESRSILEKIKANEYSLVMVSASERSDGFATVKKIRDASKILPLILLTHNNHEDFQKTAYKSGANLFHRKPINFELLAIQIDTLTKIYNYREIICIGDLQLEPSKRLVKKSGKIIDLSYKEYELLLILVKAEGDVLTRDEILMKTNKIEIDSNYSSIDTLVSRTRKKLGVFQGKAVIETVYGVGFRLNLSYFKRF